MSREYGLPLLEARAGARPDGYHLFGLRVFTRCENVQRILYTTSFRGLPVKDGEAVHLELGIQPEPAPEQLEVAFVLGDRTLVPYTSHLGEVLYIDHVEKLLDALRDRHMVGVKVSRL